MKKGKIIFEQGEIGVLCKYVYSHIYFFAEPVRVFYRGGKLFAAEIIRKRAQGKILAAHVRRVRAEIKSRFKFIEIARRR